MARRATLVLAVPATVLLAGCSLFAPDEATQGSVDVLEVGTCFDTDDAGDATTVAVRDCGEPHAYEVFHQLAVPGEQYPGEEVLRVAADDGCLAEFQGYVGTPYEDSELDIEPILPGPTAWDEEGAEPQIRCALFDDTGAPLEDTARSSDR